LVEKAIVSQKAHEALEVWDPAFRNGYSFGEFGESDGLAVVVYGIRDAELDSTLQSEGVDEAVDVVPEMGLSVEQFF